MLGKLTVSLIAVLLLSCAALASVGQTQGFAIGAFNDVINSGCVGSAEGGNTVTVGHTQKVSDFWQGVSMRQQEGATLTQNAKVIGSRANDSVGQTGSIEGLQSQYVRPGREGLRSDEQTLGGNLETLVTHKGAIGRVVSEQSLVGSQSQREATRSGLSEASQSVQVNQFTEIRGGWNSNVKVNNGVDVSLSQSNFVTGTH